MESELHFRRSSRCNEGGGCVGVAAGNDAVYVRDLKESAGPVLTVSPTAWRQFVDGLKAGEFDN